MKKIILALLLFTTFFINNTFANTNETELLSKVEKRIDNIVLNSNTTYNDIYDKIVNVLDKKNINNKKIYIKILKNLSLKIDRDITFKPYGGYESTVENTVFVEPSNTVNLNIGEKIKDLTSKSYTFIPTTQKMTDRTYWVQVGFYNAMFYVGDEEVLVLDTLAWGWGDKMIKEIRKITDKPITTVVYSHQHEDHIGDIQFFIDEAKKDGYDLKIVTTDRTNGIMEEHSSLPLANLVLDYNGDSFKFENETIKVKGFTNPAHEIDSSMWVLENEKVMHIPDYVNPNQMAYLFFGQSQTYRTYRENLEEILEFDFDFFSGGHGNIGGKGDIDFMINYTKDLEKAISEANSEINAFGYFTSNYNNHQASALTAENKVVDFVMKKLRPKYGNYYGFEASMPHQIRFVMLTNH